jgi:hypothetical protein
MADEIKTESKNKTEGLHFFIDKESKKELRKIAIDKEVGVSELLRDITKKYIEENRDAN